MESNSSLAVRAVACLLAAALLGGALTGAVAGATSGGSGAASTTNSVQTTLEETTDSTENTSDSIENTTGDVTDDAESATESTSPALEDSANETTDAAENTTTATTEAVNDTVSNATQPVETTVGESTEIVNESANDTAAVARETVNEPTGLVTDTVSGLSGTIGEPSDASAPVEPPSTSEAATNAVLVGMLGAITASGMAASGAGGAGASGAAGAGASGATGGATTATAGWLRHLRETDRLRRAVADLWKVLPIFRYSRYDDSDPLEHDCREAIYETVRERPGAYLSEVSDRTEVPLSTVRYHVRILEDEDLLTARKVNGKRRYFLEDDDAELRAALAEPAKREVLEAIAEFGRAPNGRLAEALERDPSTVSHHLAALEEDGLVVREKDGRSMVNELPERVEAALADGAPPDGESRAVPADD